MILEYAFSSSRWLLFIRLSYKNCHVTYILHRFHPSRFDHPIIWREDYSINNFKIVQQACNNSCVILVQIWDRVQSVACKAIRSGIFISYTLKRLPSCQIGRLMF